MTKMFSMVFNKTIRNPIYYVETRPTAPGIMSVIVVELCWLSSRIDKVVAQVDCSNKAEAILWHTDFCKELKTKPFQEVVELLQARYPPREEEVAREEAKVKKKELKK